MKTYKLTFTPTEPFFFGNEKTFRFPNHAVAGQFDTPYFIRSERTPSQTTMFGAVRYLLLKNRLPDFSGYPEGYEEIIGKESFMISAPGKTFGKIYNISPVFLQLDTDTDKKYHQGLYIPTPLDHNVATNSPKYTPYTRLNLKDGRQYAPEYDPKEFLPDGYMHLKTGAVVPGDDIFTSTIRVGIDVDTKDKAFFKKEYAMLQTGWSFGIYLTVEDGTEIPGDRTVYLGQNKATFLVTYTEEECTLPDIPDVNALPAEGCIVCLSDTLADSSIYASASMSITQIRDHRAFETIYQGKNSRPKYRKDSVHYKLIKAGSVFWYNTPEKRNDLLKALQNDHCAIAGMNRFAVFSV